MILNNDLPKYMNDSRMIVFDQLKDKIEKINTTFNEIRNIEISVKYYDDIENYKKIYGKFDRNFIDLSKLFLFCANILKSSDIDKINDYVALFDDLRILPLLLEEYKRKKDYLNGDRYEKMIINLITPYSMQMNDLINLAFKNLGNLDPYSLNKIFELSKSK